MVDLSVFRSDDPIRGWCSALLAEQARRAAELAQTESALRRLASGQSLPARNARYLDDPVGYMTHVLGSELWSKQREICEAIRDHRLVAIKSCHESGKSYIAGRIPCWWIDVHPAGEAKVVTSAPSAQQVQSILWEEIRTAHLRGRLPGYTNLTEWHLDVPTPPDGLLKKQLVAFGRKPEDAASQATNTAFQGQHARHMLVVFDEACGMPSSLWVAARSLIASEGGKMLVIGNPDDPNTEFGRICRPGSGWYVITISAFDSPNFTGEDVSDDLRARLVNRLYEEDMRRECGVESFLYTAKILGNFPAASSDSLIQPTWVQAAIDRTLEPVGPNELGVDVARRGNNATVIYHRRGPVARLHARLHDRDLMAVVGSIVQAVRETGATRVKIDDVGLGGGVVDRCVELKHEPGHAMRDVDVVGINVGSAPTTDAAAEHFVNLRAELCWNLRTIFSEGRIDLGDDLRTQAQLCDVRTKPGKWHSSGKIQIEAKDEMDTRLKLGSLGGESHSPDEFDALVLCFGDVAPQGHKAMWAPDNFMVDA